MDLFSFEDDDEAASKEERFLAAQNEQLAGKTKNLLSVDRQLRQDRSFLEQLGEEPPPESGRGWLPSILDFLDTPHQWAQGAIAKATGTKGYSDLGWLEAAGKGADEDLRTADLLRRNDIFTDMPFTRGIAGFFGDIVTDPLQYVTGIPQVAGIGGRALGQEAIPTLLKSTGETPAAMFERIAKARFETLSKEALKEGTANNPLLESVLLTQAKKKAEAEARSLFEGARSYSRDAAKFSKLGIAEGRDAALARKAAELGVGAKDEAKLGLQSVQDISKLYKKPTIRFTSPLMGIPGIEGLPIIGTRETDIPIVSDAVAAAHEALSNGYYGAKMKVRDWITESLAKNVGTEVGLARRTIAGAMNSVDKGIDSAARLANGALGTVSRRIKATGSIFGDRGPSAQIMQHERDRDALLKFTQLKTALAARDILDLEDGKDIMTQITRSIDSAADLFTEGTITSAQQKEAIANALAQRIADPGKRAHALKFANYIQDEYARLAAKEVEAGLLENVRDIYLPHIYDLDGQNVNFAMERKYRSLLEAKSKGLKPNEDALQLLTARKFASELAFAQKDFAERMAFQHGLDPGVYAALTEKARSGVAAERAQALAQLKELGVVNNAELQVPAWRLANGRVLDGDMFDHYQDLVRFGSKDSKPYRDLLEETLPIRTVNGVEISPEEFFNDGNRALADAMAKRFEDTQRSLLGYDGESTFARAGATTIAPFLRQKMLKDIAPGDKVFWNNLIPNHLAHAIEESYYVGDSLKRFVEKNAANQAKNGFVRAVDRSLDFLGGFNRVLKQGALSIWPARYVRDLTSAGFQAGLVSSPIEQVIGAGKNLMQLPMEIGRLAMKGGDDAANLGKHLNFHSIVQGHDIINGGKDLVTIAGNTIPNRQLMMDAVNAGFEWNGNYSTDLVATMNDMLEELARSPGMRSVIPEVGKYAKKTGELSAVQKGSKWLAAKVGLPLEDRFWQKFPDFAERLERYGRTNTFINLRSRGFDAAEAADLANRMHIDYRNAKTPFERDFLNNIFFFYSFSRGNASSLMTALMKKPGALTTQLHAFHAVGEMLKQPGAFVEDPGIEERVRSKRLSESMSMYLGKNEKTNLPRFLSGSGLPVEDLAKFGAFVPPSALSVREVVRSGAESAKRTGGMMIGQANPLIRTIAEVMTGRNFYYDRPITDETLRKVPKWEKDSSILNRYPFRAVPKEVWEGLDEVTKDVLDAKDNGDGTFTVNPYNLSILTVVAPGLSSIAPGNPIIGALSPLKYSGRFLNTRKVLTQPGVSDRDKWLRAVTGVHVDEIDPEASRLYDEKRDTESYMEFIGIPKGQRRRLQMLQAETEAEDDE